MRTFFLDTEFTELSADCRLISLALVEAGGAEFYVELSDHWCEDDCSEFVLEIVLPQLDLARHGLPKEQAAKQLRTFLEQAGPLEIVSDALAWDWPLLLDLLGPEGVPSNLLSTREDRELLRDLPNSAIPHHALLDARLMARIKQG